MARYSLLAFGAFASLISVALGQEFSPQEPAFSASPQTLQKAFNGIDSATHPAIVLLEDVTFEFDQSGNETYRYRTIFKALTKAGAEAWSIFQSEWAPWESDRPILRARVIGQDGSIHELDPKTIADAPVREGDDNVLTDRRVLKAALPAVEAGSIVEQEIFIKTTRRALNTGTVGYYQFGNSSAPVQRTIVRVRGPESIPFRFKAKMLPDVVTQDRKQNGMREIHFDQGPMKTLEKVVPLLPSSEPRSPHIVFSTGSDWHSVAQGYSAVVEKQLEGFSAGKHLPKFAASATREAKVLAIINQLNREIRYTGIEFSESSVVPHKPAEVLEHKYGDCKDKSTLAVAMLRAAGIDAHVALLLSSTGSDIEPELPGMEVFNHAIVYVPGEPALWLDLTDPDLRLGVVSPPNQGRYALIAAATTSALIQTPELTADQNKVIETREFHLSELGRAKVKESTETFGIIDREYRGNFGDSDDKALRATFKNYVEWTYGEAKLEKIFTSKSDDLAKPFQLTIELADAQRGSTGRSEAAVGIFLSQISQRLPSWFKEEPAKEDANDPAPAKPRTLDFGNIEPFTHEWHYIIHAPSGFRLRKLPEPVDERLGPATLTYTFHRESDTTVTADFRFLMPKRRMSAAEGDTLRTAVLELRKRKALLVYFDQLGETALAAGEVRDALKEFDSLSKLHPNEALHAMQTARALLAAGVGEAARKEARRAVALEPKSASAYVQLAEVLKHDLVGRHMEKGFDLVGAVDAYRNALKLNPADDESRANLAVLLEYNPEAVHYGRGARLDEAITEYQKILDKLAGLGIPQNYSIALLRAGRTKDLQAYLAKQPDNEQNQVLQICSTALSDGSKAALQLASGLSSVESRQRVKGSSAQTLLALRQYELAADFFEAAAAGAPNPAALSNLVQILRKTKRTEVATESLTRPEDAVRNIISRMSTYESQKRDWRDFLSPLAGEGNTAASQKEFQRGAAIGRGAILKSGLSVEVGFDLVQSTIQTSSSGSDETGWVVHLAIPGTNGSATQNQVWFVVKENGSYRVLGFSTLFDGVGRLVLQLVDRGELEHAKIWLDRVRQEFPAGRGDDPLDGQMFSRLWQQGQNAEAASMRCAAASLLTAFKGKNLESIIALLEQAKQTASGVQLQAISASLAEAYFVIGQPKKSLALSESLVKELPQSPNALALAVRSAYAAGGTAEAARVISAHLDTFKNNVQGLRRIATLAMIYGDAERSNAIEKQIIDSGQASAIDYNQLAWGDLMAGTANAATLEIANKGMMLGSEATGLMHTLRIILEDVDGQKSVLTESR